jgi:hypothetical protein
MYGKKRNVLGKGIRNPAPERGDNHTVGEEKCQVAATSER